MVITMMMMMVMMMLISTTTKTKIVMITETGTYDVDKYWWTGGDEVFGSTHRSIKTIQNVCFLYTAVSTNLIHNRAKVYATSPQSFVSSNSLSLLDWRYCCFSKKEGNNEYRSCLSVCLSVWLSVCLSVYLSVCLSVCFARQSRDSRDRKPPLPTMLLGIVAFTLIHFYD